MMAHKGYEIESDDSPGIDLGFEWVWGTLREHQVIYKGDTVLVCENDVCVDGDPRPIVNVPGRVLSTDGKKSQVEPVTDEIERRELTDLIQSKGIIGPINFW